MKRYTVVAVLRKDEVLMQYKLRGPFLEVWNLPGGKIEPGEDVIPSGCRELFEETRIIADPADVVQLLDMVYYEEMEAELHLLAVVVPDDTEFTQVEDEPLCWYKRCDIISNMIETAGLLNVPHFVAFAEAHFINQGALLTTSDSCMTGRIDCSKPNQSNIPKPEEHNG